MDFTSIAGRAAKTLIPKPIQDKMNEAYDKRWEEKRQKAQNIHARPTLDPIKEAEMERRADAYFKERSQRSQHIGFNPATLPSPEDRAASLAFSRKFEAQKARKEQALQDRKDTRENRTTQSHLKTILQETDERRASESRSRASSTGDIPRAVSRSRARASSVGRPPKHETNLQAIQRRQQKLREIEIEELAKAQDTLPPKKPTTKKSSAYPKSYANRYAAAAAEQNTSTQTTKIQFKEKSKIDQIKDQLKSKRTAGSATSQETPTTRTYRPRNVARFIAEEDTPTVPPRRSWLTRLIVRNTGHLPFWARPSQ
jgi:hypothetical protein